ncbi:MAG: cation transporter [Euryarchaeota archaeon]|nr:cation transporter [Euryarchaeota archaeon]
MAWKDERETLWERAALLGMVGSGFLLALKLVGGLLAGSTAVLADTMDSLADILISGLAWLGIQLSKRPPDEEHPYGHWDVEPIVGFIVAGLLVIGGIEFARYSIGLFSSPRTPTILALYVMAIDLMVKVSMARYTLAAAEKTRSPALKASGENYRSDIYKSAGIILGLWATRQGYPILDPLTGLLVSLWVVKTGLQVGRENALQLMGTVPSPAMKQEIESLVMGMEKVIHTHRVRLHGMGAYFIVDLHVCVDESISLSEAHRVTHNIQRRIVEHFPEVASAMVHIEPLDIHCARRPPAANQKVDKPSESYKGQPR